MKAKRKHDYSPDYAVPPGLTLKEVMESLGMTQKELAQRTGLTEQTIGRIFKGEQPISYETANRLELVTDVPASFWNNLEMQYREQLTKLAEQARLENDLAWLKTIPTKELVERGFIEESKDKVALLRATLAFFRVSTVEAWHSIWAEPAVAARRSPCFESRPGDAAAWIRQGEVLAQNIECAPYDKTRFSEVLPALRKLTTTTADAFVPEMQRLCSSAGVAVVLVKEMRKVPWNGATKWLAPDKAMILLSLRGKGEDRFWFSFFHEACHVLKDKKKDLLINDGSQDDPREQRADAFAAETLIPRKYHDRIKAIRTKSEILELAKELEIAPGIVAGRYQHLTNNWNRFNGLIRRLEYPS